MTAKKNKDEISMPGLGKPVPSKTDEFLEKFQTAVDPPPLIFGKSCCRFFPKFMTEVPLIMAKICNINFWIGNDPPPPPLRNFSENSSVFEGTGFPYSWPGSSTQFSKIESIAIPCFAQFQKLLKRDFVSL